MNETDPTAESTAEQEGIVDQQGAALEKMEEEQAKKSDWESDPKVGPMAKNPMEGEAPSG